MLRDLSVGQSLEQTSQEGWGGSLLGRNPLVHRVQGMDLFFITIIVEYAPLKLDFHLADWNEIK